MRIPLSWLQEYLGHDISTDLIDEACTNIGIEVDAIEATLLPFSGVLVGKIITVTQLSESGGKLSLVDVSLGNRVLHLITAAKNCSPGMHVPIAPIGAVVMGTKIEALEFFGKQFGKQSEGMMLSEEELGLGDDATGILELPLSFEVGSDLAQLCEDTIFSFSMTPNLGHCLSVFGIARELSAKLNLPLQKNWDNIPTTREEMISFLSCTPHESWEIDIFSEVSCPRYALMALHLSQYKKSPFLWRRRLSLCGLTSTYPVVDAIQLVMLELGQPMHAFDLNAFQGSPHVIIQAGQSDLSPLLLLNGEAKKPSKDTITICNAQGATLAFGGVMGGKESAVSETTTDVVIESAYFPMSALRRSRTSVDIMSESSKRFERGVDPEGMMRGLLALFLMLREMDPSLTLRALECEEKGPIPPTKPISLHISKVKALLGFQVEQNVIEQVFSRLRYPYRWIDSEVVEVFVPSYRHDVTLDVDLIEDIAKIVGFSRFDLKQSPRCHLTTLPNNPRYEHERLVRQTLVSLGPQECSTSSLIGPQNVELVIDHPIPKSALVSVQNPMSQDQSILRPSLLPGLIDVLKRNLSFQQSALSIFEIGTVFLQGSGEVREKMALGVLLYGTTEPHHALQQEVPYDFYDLKGLWEGFCHSLGIDGALITQSQTNLYHPGRQAALLWQGQQVGLLGELHPMLLKKLDIPHRVYFMEVDIQDLLLSQPMAPTKVSPLQLYPSMQRDWTASLPKTLPYQQLIDILMKNRPNILEEISLTSLFSHEKLGPDTHNVTLRFTFRDPQKTLEQEIVDRSFHTMIERATSEISHQFHGIFKGMEAH